MDFIGELLIIRYEDDPSLVPDFVDVGSLEDLIPLLPSVSRKVGVYIFWVVIKIVSDIAGSNNDP